MTIIKRSLILICCAALITGCAPRSATKNTESQCIKLYDSTEHEGQAMTDLNMDEDMDGDGKPEHIFAEVHGVDDNVRISLRVGDYELRSVYGDDVWVYGVLSVYLLDIDPKDNAKEIAFESFIDNDWTELAICRYSDGRLENLRFETDDGNIENVMLTNVYDHIDGMSVGADGGLTLPMRTRSNGMWDVYMTFRLSTDKVFREDRQDVYEVVEGTGLHMDDNGWWTIKKDSTDRGFELRRGDRVRIKYDNCEHTIMLEKDTGETGWFYMDKYNNPDYIDPDNELTEISDMFLLAG